MNKSKIKGNFSDFFGFCKTFKKIIKQLGIQKIFKTADLTDIYYAILAIFITVTKINLYKYVPIFHPDSTTEVMCNNLKKRFTLSYDSCFTDRKLVDTGLEFQIDISSSRKTNSLKYLLVTHQSTVRIRAPNKLKIIPIFGNTDVRMYFF